MRKVDDGKRKKKRKEKKRMAFLVATTSLPAVYCPNDDRWNAARSCQKSKSDQIGADLTNISTAPIIIEASDNTVHR